MSSLLAPFSVKGGGGGGGGGERRDKKCSIEIACWSNGRHCGRFWSGTLGRFHGLQFGVPVPPPPFCDHHPCKFTIYFHVCTFFFLQFATLVRNVCPKPLPFATLDPPWLVPIIMSMVSCQIESKQTRVHHLAGKPCYLLNVSRIKKDVYKNKCFNQRTTTSHYLFWFTRSEILIAILSNCLVMLNFNRSPHHSPKIRVCFCSDYAMKYIYLVFLRI